MMRVNKKGALSEAAESALQQWSSEQMLLFKDLEKIDDPVKAVSGMLSHVKKDSVTLQHEIGKILSDKHVRHRR